MALTTRTLPSIMNGISQQPAILRATDQTADELNTWSKIANGLSRRPPTQNVASITGLPAAGTYSLHHINRDINERYNVIIANGSIRVFDGITGVEKTVNAPRGYSYLNQTGDVYRAVTVADYTFIVNITKTVALAGGTPASAPTANGGLGQSAGGTLAATTYYVRSTFTGYSGETTAAPETSLAVAVNNVLVVAPPASPPAWATGWKVYASTTPGTETLQATLSGFGANWTEPTTGLVAGAALPSTNTAVQGADQLPQNANNRFLGGTHVTEYPVPGAGYFNPGDPIQYNPNPTYGGGLTGTVTDSTKLPATVCSGCVYKVLGQKDTAFTPYYVMGDGTVWNETVAPGLKNALDETTMPWALIRNADGTFTFAPFSWKPRRVGDDSTNPPPMFVGRTIRDIFYYQNRLGFAADNGVVFSAVGDLGNFYRRTVLDYLDSDTVAANAATTDVAIVDYALAYHDGVMLFSRQRQLSVTNADAGLSSRSLAIAPVTSYVMATGVRPTPMGSQAHFLSEARGWLAVQEYSRLVGGDPTEAADITAHVPNLIPKGASRIIPMHDLNALVILMNNSTDPTVNTKAYVYQFFWSGAQKLLSAWRIWDFGDGRPITGAYESGNLMLLVQRPDGTYLEKIDATPNGVTPNQTNNIYLDRQVSVTGTYNAGTNRTTFTLPYAPTQSTLNIVTGSDAATPQSLIDPTTYTFPTTTTVTVPGNITGHVSIGNSYKTSVTLSEQFPYMTENYRSRPITSGRLQIHAWTVNLVNTAYIRAEVHPYGPDATALNPNLKVVTPFSPYLLGSPQAVLGKRPYYTGAWQFSAQGKSSIIRVDLVNDSPFEHTITSAQWEGLFFSRAM